MDKMRKNQLAMEQLQTDYNTEKSSVVKLEGQRSMLERQNKELKAKLAEMEAEVRSKTKATIAALESKVSSFVLFFYEVLDESNYISFHKHFLRW